MKARDAEILIVTGPADEDGDIWTARWERNIASARRVREADGAGKGPSPRHSLKQAVESATRPVVLVAHDVGVLAVAHAVSDLPEGRVKGAFLVGMPDADDPEQHSAQALGPIPRAPLPFPALLVASRTDPYCPYDKAEDIAYAWGAQIIDAGDAGHLDAASGRGPWPEGLMTFTRFLGRL